MRKKQSLEMLVQKYLQNKPQEGEAMHEIKQFFAGELLTERAYIGIMTVVILVGVIVKVVM